MGRKRKMPTEVVSFRLNTDDYMALVKWASYNPKFSLAKFVGTIVCKVIPDEMYDTEQLELDV